MEEKRHCLIFDMTKAGIFATVINALMTLNVGFSAEYNRDKKCIITFACSDVIWRILNTNVENRFWRHRLKDYEEEL